MPARKKLPEKMDAGAAPKRGTSRGTRLSNAVTSPRLSLRRICRGAWAVRDARLSTATLQSRAVGMLWRARAPPYSCLCCAVSASAGLTWETKRSKWADWHAATDVT